MKITRRQLRRIIREALELDWMDDIDAADVVDIIAKHDTYQGKQAGEALMNGMSVGDIINQLPGYLKGTITSELESFGSSPSASAVGDEGDEGPPAGAHSEYTIPGMATNKNAASVTVYDDEGNSVDEYTISLHPDYGNPGYEANPQPTDMTEFVQWAQSHDLFSLPAWDDSLPGNVPFEEIIMILDEQDEYGKAYQFPSGTPGAS